MIDGMGGGIGGQITAQLRRELPAGADITALGTNAAATAAMLKAGADRGATGENAIIFSAQFADVIVGPLGIIIPNAMLGEISPAIAAAVIAAPAPKMLLPVPQPHIELIGIELKPLSALMREVAEKIKLTLA